ncbi:MAG: carbohydrate-binding protein, partial [Rhodococcus ruber]|nr:carbohydrate-binding protein [Rhodococcus ruber]
MRWQASAIALLVAVLAATPARADEPATDGVPGSGPCAGDTWRHESLVPKDLDIPVPYPVITTVPYPAPEPDPVRIDPPPLPVDPCTDPCPDLTDEPAHPDPVFPRIALKPSPFHLGIPVPGEGAAPPPPPAPETPPIEPAPRVPAPPAPRVVEVATVAKQTGAGSVNRTDKRWQVYGTDL